MDLVKQVMKVQADKNYKKGWFLLCNLILVYALTGSAYSLFSSYPFWFSSLSCCVKEFLFIHLPYIWSSFSKPKWLFVVANVIIVVLVGESNFVGSNSSSSACDQYYDEYVARSKRPRGHASSYNSLQEKKKEVNMTKEEVNLTKESEDKVDEAVKEEVIKEQEKEVEIEKDDHKEEEEEEEEEVGLPAQELTKRVEDFIARVNKQRWLEAKSLVCCRA